MFFSQLTDCLTTQYFLRAQRISSLLTGFFSNLNISSRSKDFLRAHGISSYHTEFFLLSHDFVTADRISSVHTAFPHTHRIPHSSQDFRRAHTIFSRLVVFSSYFPTSNKIFSQLIGFSHGSRNFPTLPRISSYLTGLSHGSLYIFQGSQIWSDFAVLHNSQYSHSSQDFFTTHWITSMAPWSCSHLTVFTIS